MNDEPARFGPVDVLQIASKLTIDDATFVIGGQATNLWAWFYQDRAPELSSDTELTSKDIDYFGTKKAAESLAQALGGKVYFPNADDMNTPNTAVVVAEVNGKKLQIDFMHGVLGLTKRELENGVSIIRLEAESDGKLLQADVAIMHPVLCLKSRVANMLSPATMRQHEFAWQQLHSSIAVMEVYIGDALIDGDIKEVNHCFWPPHPSAGLSPPKPSHAPIGLRFHGRIVRDRSGLQAPASRRASLAVPDLLQVLFRALEPPRGPQHSRLRAHALN